MTTQLSRILIATGIAFIVTLSSVAAFAAMPTGASVGTSHDSAAIQIAKKKKMTPREEADKSYKDGTVPSRYRSQVPKEYQQYIPFSKQ